MAREIEIKLTLPESQCRRFLCTPLLKQANERHSERLLNIYYDTPDLALLDCGIALRLRRSRRHWLQTVKCAGIAHGGLSSRPEWETTFSGQFDFSAIDDGATRKVLERFTPHLQPVFETSFLRTTWKLQEANTDLIVAFDRGSVVAGGKLDPISEVEIEIGNGELGAIFALSERLMAAFPLTPSHRSKAERGYRLFLGQAETPVHGSSVALDKTMSPTAAFRQIAHACLDHLQRNHDGAVHSDDVEYFHQMRVAIRRLSAALRLFRPALPEQIHIHLRPPMRSLMTILGQARDLDVLAGDIVDPVAYAMPAEPRVSALSAIVANRRHTARNTAVLTLNGDIYGRLLLLTIRELHLLSDENAALPGTCAEFANVRLQRLQRRFLALAFAAKKEDPKSLHALRIGGKRLRYALEFFSPLLPVRPTTDLLKQLSRLQDILGELNDLANAGQLLMACAVDDPGLREAVSLIGGWHGRRHARLRRSIPPLLQKLNRAKLPKAR